MSAMAQIIDQVETRVAELLGRLTRKDKEQDNRLDKIEERLDALETPPPSVKAKPTAARSTGTASSTK